MAHESPATLKKNLPSILSDMQSASHLFVKHPGKDFFQKTENCLFYTICFLLTMTGNTLRREWVGFPPGYGSDSCLFPTTSKITSRFYGVFIPHIQGFFFIYGYIRGYPAIIAAASLLIVVLCGKERGNKRLYPIIHKRWIIGIGIMSGCWHPDERIMSLLVPISVISSG